MTAKGNIPIAHLRAVSPVLMSHVPQAIFFFFSFNINLFRTVLIAELQ